MPLKSIPEPWASFLADIDSSAQDKIELHCLGGFVVTVVYGLARPTADVDVLVIAPRGESEQLLSLAGQGSTQGWFVSADLLIQYHSRRLLIFPAVAPPALATTTCY